MIIRRCSVFPLPVPAYFLIKQASGNEDFYKLIEGGFASTGTLNFWNEYLILKMITSAGA